MYRIRWYRANPPTIDGNAITHNYPDVYDFYIPGDKELAITEGRLSEESGRAGSLSFTVPATHPHKDDVRLYLDAFTVEFRNPYDDNPRAWHLIWYGRVISCTVNIDNSVSYTCEGALAILNDIMIPPTKDISEADAVYYGTPTMYMDELIEWYNNKSTFGYPGITHYGTDAPEGQILVQREGYNTILYELNDYFVNKYGGFYTYGVYLEDFDHPEYLGSTLWHRLEPESFANDSEYDLKVGRNILELSVNLSSLDVVTEAKYEWYTPNGDLGGVDDFSLFDNTGSSVSDIFKSLTVSRKLKVNNCQNRSEAFNLVKQYCVNTLEESVEVSLAVVDPVFVNKQELYYAPRYAPDFIVRFFMPGASIGIKLMISKREIDLVNPGRMQLTLGKPRPSASQTLTRNKISEKIQDETQIF